MIRCSRRGPAIFRSGNVEERIINEFNVTTIVQFHIRREAARNSRSRAWPSPSGEATFRRTHCRGMSTH